MSSVSHADTLEYIFFQLDVWPEAGLIDWLSQKDISWDILTAALLVIYLDHHLDIRSKKGLRMYEWLLLFKDLLREGLFKIGIIKKHLCTAILLGRLYRVHSAYTSIVSLFRSR